MNRDITKKYTRFNLLKHDLKMFNRYFNQCIGISKNDFHHKEFSKYRVVRERRGIYQKEMKSDFPSCFVHDGVEIIGTTYNTVADKFIEYFTEIGTKLARSIDTANTLPFNSYLTAACAPHSISLTQILVTSKNYRLWHRLWQ